MSVEETYERLRDDQDLLVLHRRHLLRQKSEAWLQERWQDCLQYKLTIDRVDRQLSDITFRMVQLRIMGGAA